MSSTQFAMVEELAFLVKDNLPCKHLILSMEDSLVNFLQDNSSSDGVLELEPTNAYNRLLLHRLAEIFGFSHQSVGEGDFRHLLLERCLETSIPSVLVSDLLCEYDKVLPRKSSNQLLRSQNRTPVASGFNNVVKFEHSLPNRRQPDPNLNRKLCESELKSDIAIGQLSLEQRETSYLAARERIFTGYNGEINGLTEKKPRGDPVVARRMISHALGQKIDPSKQTLNRGINGTTVMQSDKIKFQQKDLKYDTNETEVSRTRRSKIGLDKESLKKEQTGAAKRMFANALGFHPGKNGIKK